MVKSKIVYNAADTKDTSIIAYGYVAREKKVKITYNQGMYHVWIKWDGSNKFQNYNSYPASLLLDGVIKALDYDQLVADVEQRKEDMQTWESNL